MGMNLDWHGALAALDWQVDLGATEAIADAPVDRFAESEALAARAAAPAAPMAPPVPAPPAVALADADPVAEAQAAAGAARTLEELRDAMAAYEHCALKGGARSLVFADGRSEARVMIVGEAPGRDEDLQGLPFVGKAGQLLDRMFAAIGLGRAEPDPGRALYITNVLPWRPPQNRDPTPQEIAMLRPFLERHIALADPALLVVMGNISCDALLGRRGITRLRGTWTEALGRPTLPMFHPSFLLRQPVQKRQAWADLLTLKDRLEA